MADYLSTNTPRLRFTQTGPRGTHKMQFRVVPGTTPTAALTAATPVIESLIAFTISNVYWAAAEWASEGSDVFLPIDFSPLGHADAAENVSNQHEYGRYINFVGRSASGSRVAFYLFNVLNATMSANNRLTQAENVYVAPTIAAFAANSTVLCAIDQQPFVLKAYANTGINDQVAKKSRSLV